MSLDDGVVLIVEDDADDRDLLARAFKRAGIDVPLWFAKDGDEAVAYLEGVAFDMSQATPFIVLLDLKLPRRSGFEVLEWIKRNARLRRIPVIILTSSRENVDLERAYDLGANSYLVKPARPEALRQMVEHINAYWLGLNEMAMPGRSLS
ncbi:MAG: response regulator [Pseudomonadota bacterium]|jgi:CheY-like chemotaxis protein|nr:response regulator [Pseudomonadota bacterium]